MTTDQTFLIRFCHTISGAFSLVFLAIVSVALTWAPRAAFAQSSPPSFVKTRPQLQFRQIFDLTGRNAALTLITAFGDPSLDEKPRNIFSFLYMHTDAQRQLFGILTLTETAPNSPTHFNWVIAGDGTKQNPPTGDDGFREEFRDSFLHPSSGNQIGHFLTAASMGHATGMHDKWGSPGQATSINNSWIRAIVGHELVPDGSASHLAQAWTTSREQISFFVMSRPDLIILNTTQKGNSYQDLYLSCVGYRFGKLLADGAIIRTRHDAMRWLMMALTNVTPLDSFLKRDPFYNEAQWLKELLGRFPRQHLKK